MKRGQLLSQPFFYIFTIIVIGLILIFGFRYVGKILKTGCEVENLDLINDIKAQVNQLRSLSYGSSYECSFSRIGGNYNKCEFIVPKNINGICFIDLTKGQFGEIPFDDVRETTSLLGTSANKNLFFSTREGSACKPQSVMINNLEIKSPVCMSITTENSFIMENTGNFVEIKIS